MKLYSKILLSAIGALALSGCHSAIMSDLTECPQYTVFTFDVRTPDEISFPDNKIDDVRVFAFDESGKLIGEWKDGSVAFLPGYEIRTDFYRPGATTSFVAWAGKDLGLYDFSAFKAGADKKDLLVFMAKEADKIGAKAAPLYVAEPTGGDLVQKERSTLGTQTDEVHFSFVQITNHFHFDIQGLSTDHTYTMTFTAKNSRYKANGDLAEDTPFEWTTDTFKQTADGVNGTARLTADYDILRLVQGERGDYLITIKDETGRVVYEFDPLADFILYPGLGMDGSGNPFKDHLDLNHDFNISIVVDTFDGTYMAVRATIQNWNIVFRHESL